MSLIFEALKKLDREKQAPERGFLVVGASGWGGARRARAIPIAAALAAAGVAGFLFAQWAQRPKVETASSAAPATAPNAARAAPPTAPPATYAAPALPAVAREAAPPPAPPRAGAPVVPATARPTTTQPPVPEALAPAPVEPTFVLQAVTERDGEPVAIVNGQLVRVGDTVEGAQVVRIDAQMVELTKGGRRIVVSF